MDENVKGKPEHVSWEDVIWQMKDVNKNLRYAIEISKDEPMDYLRYSIEELNRKCEHWGLDEFRNYIV